MTSGGAGAIRAAVAPDASFSASRVDLLFASTTTAAATDGVAIAARWRFGGAPADDRHAAVAGGLPAPSSDASDKERARLCRRSRDWGVFEQLPSTVFSSQCPSSPISLTSVRRKIDCARCRGEFATSRPVFKDPQKN